MTRQAVTTMFSRLLAFLSLALVATGATADERWLEVRSPHFRVITNAAEREGRSVATGFEQLRKLFLALGTVRVDPPVPVVIVATRNEQSLRSFLPSYWERRGGVRPAGVFRPGTDKHHILMQLDVDPEFRDDIVYHEYAHVVVKLNFAALPVWLNEGLAEFYAGTKVRQDRVIYGRVNPNRLAVLRQRPPLPLADLFAIDGGSREYNEESRASVLYAQSALLTHYFLVGDKGAHREQLLEYFRQLGQGASPQQAQAKAFGDLKALENGFFSYLHRHQFLALTSPVDVSGATTTVQPLRDAEVLALRGDFLARHGSETEARSLLRKARELDPGLPLAAQALGVLEARAGRPAEALRHLAEAVRLAPDDFASHYLSAREQARSRDAADLVPAEAALQRSLQLNPSFAPAHALLSSVQRGRGQVEQAFLSLHKACELEPNRGVYWVQRADLLRQMNRPDVADAIETQLAQLAPSDPEQLTSLAVYYRAEGRQEDLERLLRKTADLSPRSTQAPRMLGWHLRALGRGDEAEAAFRRALAAQPDHPSILNELAYHNAQRGVKLPEALQMIDRALKALPQNGAMLATKGWTLFRMDRLEEAERYLRRALERRDDPEVIGHLGDVLDGRGQRAAARELWRRALEHAKATDEQKEALRGKLTAPDQSGTVRDTPPPGPGPLRK